MIYIAIPSVTPRLARCAQDAIGRTTPEPHRVIVARGRSHGENLDAAFAGLPEDAEYMMTMDDDAAPLRVGWLSWLLGKIGGRRYFAFGDNMVVGCLYRVSALRPFGQVFATTRNPGDVIRDASPDCHWARSDGPWWLRNCETYRDDDGELVFAHLGGGTIGHTWYHQGRFYPRIPTWLWPVLVKRYLRRIGVPARLVHGRPHDARMVGDHQ